MVAEKGKLTLQSGDVYEGEYINEVPHGKGKMTYKDGKVEEGRWKDGKLLGEEEERKEERKRTKKLVLHLCLSAAYLFILWGTDIIRAPWEHDAINFLSYLIRCLPLIIFSSAIGMVSSIFSKKEEDDSGYLLPILMVLVQSITICVWREDVGILLIYLIARIVINTLSIVPGFVLCTVYTKQNKLTKAQEEAVQELKESENYAFALQLKETLERMNKGCDFKEPSIGFNSKHKHQAYAVFTTKINIPSEEKPSFLRIHTTLYGYEHQCRMDDCVRSWKKRGCVLDMGTTTVDSDEDFQELIDGVFKVLFVFATGSNLYVKGELACKPSDTLPVYPRA